MSKYRDQGFGTRFATMGDPAEDVFEAALPLGKATRFGFRRPKGLRFTAIPEMFRHMPDFITATYLVEVMGMGRDGILKSMKVTKYEALKEWQKFALKGGLMGVALFVWNSSERQYITLSWQDIVEEVRYSRRKHDGPLAFENDGNEYYPLEWERLIKRGQAVAYDES